MMKEFHQFFCSLMTALLIFVEEVGFFYTEAYKSYFVLNRYS